MKASISIRNFCLIFGRAYTSNTRTNTRATNKHKHHSKSFTMAPMTATQNRLKSEDLSIAPGKGGFMSFPGITAESSRKLSELLQKNRDEYHGFFAIGNRSGMCFIIVYPDLLYNTDVS